MKIPPFISSVIQRFLTDNPLWAKRIQAASLVLMVLAWTPELLSYLEIPSPDWLEVAHNKIVKIGSLVALVLAQLPNPSVKQQ